MFIFEVDDGAYVNKIHTTYMILSYVRGKLFNSHSKGILRETSNYIALNEHTYVIVFFSKFCKLNAWFVPNRLCNIVKSVDRDS